MAMTATSTLATASISNTTAPLALFESSNVNSREVFHFGTWSVRHGPPPGSFIMKCAAPNTIALTYDDGPWKYTEELLDILEAFNMSATFFINGKNMGLPLDKNDQSMYLIHRAYTEGHQIASHTWGHVDLSKQSEASRLWNMKKLDDTIRSIINVSPTYMRPPYGSCDRACMLTMQKLGYRVVHWSLDTLDYAASSDEDILFSYNRFKSILEKRAQEHKPGAIILAHDTHERSATQLTLLMCDYILEKKLRAVTVGECLGESKELWYKK